MVNVVKAPGSSLTNPEVMVIAAHPDDLESWCGGTLAQAVDQGAIVRVLLVTSGEHGADDPALSPPEVAALREQEALAAAKLLGISEVQFLRYPDGEVENTLALKATLVRWIRHWKPAVVFSHDPEKPYPPYLCHPDHRAIGRAALDAVYPLARDRLAFAGGTQIGRLPPHKVKEVWLFASEGAESYVDIASGFERKIAARLAHLSQTPDPAALPHDWEKRAAAFGQPAGLPLAENFTILSL